MQSIGISTKRFIFFPTSILWCLYVRWISSYHWFCENSCAYPFGQWEGQEEVNKKKMGEALSVWKHGKWPLIHWEWKVAKSCEIEFIKSAKDDSQGIHKMRKTCETRHVCVGYFVFFMLIHETDFSCLASQTVSRTIMHEAKGFSRVISNKIIVRENNQIAKCV